MTDPTPLTAEEERTLRQWAEGDEAMSTTNVRDIFATLDAARRTHRAEVEALRARQFSTMDGDYPDAERERYRRLDPERLARATATAWRSVWSESASMGWHVQCWFDEDIIRNFEDGTVAEAIAAEYAALSPEEEGTAVRRLPPADPSIVTTTRE